MRCDRRTGRGRPDDEPQTAVRLIVFACCLGAGFGGSARAQVQVPLPPLDLGQTNILDGEGGPGALLEIITAGSGADRLADAGGHAAPGANDQQIVSAILHPIYVSGAVVAGAHPGVELLVPLSYVHNGFAGPSAGHDAGLGDVTVEPFLQWSKPHAGPPTISWRLGLGVVAPSGAYDSAASVNSGGGGWQISPYLASTWRASTRWELSARAIYDWSGTVRGRSPAASPIRLQAGDQFALDMSVSYAVTPGWRLGLGGYLLRQIDESRAGDLSTPHGLQRVDAFGPVSRWAIGRTNVLAAAFREFGAENRPQGISVNVRLQQPL